jgi:hypothetical protein
VYVALNKAYERVPMPPGEKSRLLRWRKKTPGAVLLDNHAEISLVNDDSRKKQRVA